MKPTAPLSRTESIVFSCIMALIVLSMLVAFYVEVIK